MEGISGILVDKVTHIDTAYLDFCKAFDLGAAADSPFPLSPQYGRELKVKGEIWIEINTDYMKYKVTKY